MPRTTEALVTALPAAGGLAVQAGTQARLLPWPLAAQLLDDPGLVVQTTSMGDCSPWDTERLLAACAAGDGAALRLLTACPQPPRRAVQELARHPRRWRHTRDLAVFVGRLASACCRAGLALPSGEELADVALVVRLFAGLGGQVAVRSRLAEAYPHLGDAAWSATTGQLAERIVLDGARREDVRRAIAPGDLLVAELLGDAGRFRVRRADVRMAADAILGCRVRWDAEGRLELDYPPAYGHPVGGVALAFGVGGMHSSDPPGLVEGPLVDLDVASYYPSLIATDRITPPQLPDFAARTQALLRRRLEAKRAGDAVTASALKYVINSLYGQLGNDRSALFSPADALRVVLTGQLRLLQLIDGVLESGCALISANTDGIIVRGDPGAAAAGWEAAPGLTLERTPYRRLWRTSVNDYVAQGPDGGVAKAKGRFGGGDEDGSARRSAAPIIARAVVDRLVHGRDPAAAVARADAVTDFTCWRRARGLQWDGAPVAGPVVRWVVAARGRPLVQSTASRETSTVAAHALLVPDPALADLAAIDRAWYLQEAGRLVDQVEGTTQGARQLSLLEGVVAGR
jgi:hypothetical protein